MKVRRLPEGAVIEIGDKIRCEHALGVSWHTVTKVHKKYAFAKVNDHAEEQNL